MSNRWKVKNPTTSVLEEILAEVREQPESTLDEVATELSDVSHQLERLDAAELLRTEGADASRYGLEQLHEAVADLMSAYAVMADAVGQAVATTTAHPGS
jgi:archaellum component FlaC